MDSTTELTVGQRIENALVSEGRKKLWLVNMLKEIGLKNNDEILQGMTDVKLSRRLNLHEEFEPSTLSAISKILKIKL